MRREAQRLPIPSTASSEPSDETCDPQFAAKMVTRPAMIAASRNLAAQSCSMAPLSPGAAGGRNRALHVGCLPEAGVLRARRMERRRLAGGPPASRRLRSRRRPPDGKTMERRRLAGSGAEGLPADGKTHGAPASRRLEHVPEPASRRRTAGRMPALHTVVHVEPPLLVSTRGAAVTAPPPRRARRRRGARRSPPGRGSAPSSARRRRRRRGSGAASARVQA